MHGSAFYIFLRLVTETLVKNTIFRPLCHTSTTLPIVSRSQVALCPCCSQFLCPGQVSAAILSLFPACHFFGAQTQEGQDPLFPLLPPVQCVQRGSLRVLVGGCSFLLLPQRNLLCLFPLSAVLTKLHFNCCATLCYFPALFLLFLLSFCFKDGVYSFLS